jgi:putative serine protease PepD
MTQQPPPQPDQSSDPSEVAPQQPPTRSFSSQQPQPPTQAFAAQPPPPEEWPQQPEHGTEHTAPLWYQQTQTQYPAYSSQGPQAAAEPSPDGHSQSGATHTRSAGPRRLAELGAVALVAAILASTGTYAATRDDAQSSPLAQSSTSAATTAAPVLQADASAPNWSVTAGAVSPSVVAISVTNGQSGGQGSGVIFDTSGRILTNNHVVAAAGNGSKLSVTLNDKRVYDATAVGTDPSTDLAVIKLTDAPGDLKAIALGDSKALKVGDQVMAVGNPLGLAGTVTTGIVSALNRPVTTSDQPQDPSGQQPAAEQVVTNAIQTSAAINPGNSGGALVNASGQLVGINSAIASLGSSGSSSSQSGNIGIGFAIPVNEARSIADQLVASGKATHPYLGVASKNGIVTDGSAKRAGAVLTNVVSGFPADKAGLRPGDAIVGVDGNSIDGSLSLVAQIRERSVGEKVTLKIVRDGSSKELSVTLIAKPTTNQ